MEKDPRDVIIRPVITEHSYDAMENNVYTFEVAKDANKVEIRQAIQEGPQQFPAQVSDLFQGAGCGRLDLGLY